MLRVHASTVLGAALDFEHEDALLHVMQQKVTGAISYACTKELQGLPSLGPFPLPNKLKFFETISSADYSVRAFPFRVSCCLSRLIYLLLGAELLKLLLLFKIEYWLFVCILGGLLWGSYHSFAAHKPTLSAVVFLPDRNHLVVD